MKDELVIRVDRRTLYWIGAAALIIYLLFFSALPLPAQKVQEDYDKKFKIADSDTKIIALATSDDGRYVYVVGRKGILVSDDHGKTGSWVQTVRMK